MIQKKVQRPGNNDNTSKNTGVVQEEVEIPEVESILASLNKATKTATKEKKKIKDAAAERARLEALRREALSHQSGCCM